MFKKIFLTMLFVLVIGVLIFGAIYRTQAKNTNENSRLSGNSRRQGDNSSKSEQFGNSTKQENSGFSQNGSNLAHNENENELSYLPAAVAGKLSSEETNALLYMREEEKLAYDVYTMLYAKWGLRPFQNISQSEQTHTETIKFLIDRYGITDSASSQAGVYTNQTLQDLYNHLSAQGSQSIAEALKVGASIEEIDILDLEKRLAKTDNADIQQVFNDLKSGSTNHLRSFVRTLNNQTGESYQPKYISTEAFREIVNTINQTGNGNGQGRGATGFGLGRNSGNNTP